MTQVVYIDVLFVVNLVIDYYILLAVASVFHRKEKRLRLFIGACLGAAYACLIYFPQLDALFGAGLKLICSAVIVAVSFKCRSVKLFFKLLAAFYIVSAAFGGITFALWYFITPPGLSVRNGVTYVDISPIMLIAAGTVCYIVIVLVSRFMSRRQGDADIYDIVLEADNKSVALMALLDSGNDLCDSFSGLPVIIAEYSSIEALIPPKIRVAFSGGSAQPEFIAASDWNKRFRLIPYSSVGDAGGMLPAFKPDRLTIKKEGIDCRQLLVAVSVKTLSKNAEFTALLNPHIFSAAKFKTSTNGGKNLDLPATAYNISRKGQNKNESLLPK